MIKKYENKQLKLNADLKGKARGSVINIEVDKDGTPMDRYWRDRLKDSEIDGCVEWVPGKKKSGKANSSEK